VRPYGRPGISLLHRKSFFLTLVLKPVWIQPSPSEIPTSLPRFVPRDRDAREARISTAIDRTSSPAPVEDRKDLSLASYESLVRAGVFKLRITGG